MNIKRLLDNRMMQYACVALGIAIVNVCLNALNSSGENGAITAVGATYFAMMMLFGFPLIMAGMFWEFNYPKSQLLWKRLASAGPTIFAVLIMGFQLFDHYGSLRKPLLIGFSFIAILSVRPILSRVFPASAN